MNLQQEGEYAVVSYHDKVYYRLEGETTFSWYIKKGVSVTYPVPTLVMVNDAETERLLEGIYYNHIQVKKEKEQQTKSPVEEAYKDWWGQYPELETDGDFDVTRWHGFQAGYEFAWAIAHAKKVVEKVQEEQEDTVWKSVALRFGEKLSDVGPVGYYDFTPEEWFDWAVFFTYGKEQYKDYKVGVDEPSMTNCVLTGNPPDGYVAWNEWYNEMGSKGILHNLKISSKDYKPTPQERGERVHKEAEELVLESVIWCEEHPDKDPLDWVKPQTPEQVADGLKEAFREAVKQGVVSSSTKPQNLYDLIADCMVKYNSIVYPELICDILDAVEEWLPDDDLQDGKEYQYRVGWNACLKFIREKLK
jgi:hypothetical protein